jgi:predicted dehydrogenase
MSLEKLVGIVGTGFIGAAHARAARAAGARLVGVSASTPARAKEAASRLGAQRGFDSAEELIADANVEVVHICTPTDLHAPLTLEALAAGKHVICEKPLAGNLADAQAMTAALGAAGTVGCVPFVYRYYPMVRELRARVLSGEVGRRHLAHGTYLQDWLSRRADTNWRIDPAVGGPSRAVADIGSHWFDLLEFVTGDRVQRLSARFGTAHPDRSTEDLAAISFETRDGMLGSLVVSQVAQGHKNDLVLEVSGSRASARFDQEHPGVLWLGHRDRTTILAADPASLASDAARHVAVPAGHPQGYLDCVDQFVRDAYTAFDGSTPEGLPTFADGLRAVTLVDAALRSAAGDGAWLQVAA